MSIFRLRLSSILALLTLLFMSAMSAVAGWTAPAATSPIDNAVRQAIAGSGEARVLLVLDEANGPQPVATLQDSVLAQLPVDGFRVIRRYQTLPALAGYLNAEGLAALENEPLLASLQLDAQGGSHLADSTAAIEANWVWDHFGYTGEGVRVAVLDSGVDTGHPDLANDIVVQHCFTDGDCAPYKSDEGTSAEDENGHGTNVTGIITADGVLDSSGVAPNAQIVAIRVLDARNWGWLSDWVAGLDWIVANQHWLQVDIVNMSLGTWALYAGDCDDEWSIMADALEDLNALGITVFASSGNKGAPDAMGSPACNRRAVAVGATYDGYLGRQPDYSTYQGWYGGSFADCYDAYTSVSVITCFSNSGSMLDVVAPGARITSSGNGGGLSTYVGTSQAAPTAAGIAALMLQANPALSPAQIETALKQSGPLLVDGKNNLSVPSLNARTAVSSILAGPPLSLTLEMPSISVLGIPTAFIARTQPATTTLPLHYEWQATGLQPIVHDGGLVDSAIFTWSSVGPQTITLTVTNPAGQTGTTSVVNVVPGSGIFLPQVRRASP